MRWTERHRTGSKLDVKSDGRDGFRGTGSPAELGIQRSRDDMAVDQDADLLDVRHVCDDDRLGRHHHSRDHQRVSTVADGRRNLSVRDDGGHRAGGLVSRAARRRFGRRRTIVIGLTLFAVASYLFAAGDTFAVFAVLMGLSGIAIGVFKTGALALIGDISSRRPQHTSIMNTVEGFFGIGSIVGAGRPRRSACQRRVVEVALRHCRNHVRRADRHGVAVKYRSRPVRRPIVWH